MQTLSQYTAIESYLMLGSAFAQVLNLSTSLRYLYYMGLFLFSVNLLNYNLGGNILVEMY